MEYNIKVLIADENAEERKKLRGALAAASIFSVDEVSNGEEALKRLQGGGYTAAVIDLWLSGIDGIGIIRKLRTPEPSARGTYLIVTSGTKGNGVLFDEDKTWSEYMEMVKGGLIAPEVALGWRFNMPSATEAERAAIRRRYMPEICPGQA